MKSHPVLRRCIRIIAVAFCLFWIAAALIPLRYRVFNIASVMLCAAFAPPLILLIVPPIFRWIRARRVGRILLRAVGALYAAVFLLAAVLSVKMLAACANRPDETGDATCVILGCQVNGPCNPSPILAGRLAAAYTYLLSHPNASCVVTGCQGPDEGWSEASVMRRWLMQKGIDGSRIYEEDAAADTRENLYFSATVIRENHLSETVVIATDWWHQLRASVWAERAGLTACAVSSAVPRDGVWPLDALYFARELLGLARLTVLGY